MGYSPRIYVHAPYKSDLADRVAVKSAVLDLLRGEDLDPQEFHVSGLPRGDSWTFDRAIDVMRQCDGAIILALARWIESDGVNEVPIPSEYSHFEGALALARRLPTLVVAEQGMHMRGILSQLGGTFVVQVPMPRSASWIARRELLDEPPTHEWLERVKGRCDVFFGYCSKASELARNIKTFLESDGLRVHDWATAFRPGRTIMEEVKRAAVTSRCGLFLFTADDPIEGSQTVTAIPRDNVLLEAGYFMSAAGQSRTLVVRESGTKMPADLGGIIYLTIDDRSAWQASARQIADAIRTQINQDAS
jgi:predicted nucleotide-binding protein with TIR-like domain